MPTDVDADPGQNWDCSSRKGGVYPAATFAHVCSIWVSLGVVDLRDSEQTVGMLEFATGLTLETGVSRDYHPELPLACDESNSQAWLRRASVGRSERCRHHDAEGSTRRRWGTVANLRRLNLTGRRRNPQAVPLWGAHSRSVRIARERCRRPLCLTRCMLLPVGGALFAATSGSFSRSVGGPPSDWAAGRASQRGLWSMGQCFREQP